MKEFFNICLTNKITPNQLYLLYCVREKIKTQNLNISLELRGLIEEWLTKDYKLTNKASLLLKEVDLIKVKELPKQTQNFEENVKKYREMFPKGMLPSGKQARQSEPELQKKFLKFFSVYGSYDWDTIFKATENYINQFQEPYMYMTSSTYFIMKQDNYKNNTSQLADYCEAILTGETSNEKHYEQKII